MADSLPRFVQQRQPDWEALTALLQKSRRGELQLAEVARLDLLYRRASRDLAHAQSFFPGTDATRYLNGLCAQAYGAIYRPSHERLAATRTFFAVTFPTVLREELRYVGVSALLMVAGLILGAAVVLLEPRGAQMLVPEHLRAYLSEGRMWTDDILSVSPPGAVSAGIATNNLSVTIAAFGLGLTGGLGTVFILINNGVLLGAVGAACAQAGMLSGLLTFIAAHGPVELSVIAIAGGAGLMIGHALAAPGELPRQEALRLRGRRAAELLVGCAPFLFGIGFIEGFISPGPLFPVWVKAGVGLTTFGLFWGYLLRAGRSSGEGSAAPAESASSFRR